MARTILALVGLAAVRAQPSLSCGTDLCFSSGLSTGAVLQRAPSRAALYGSAHANSPVGAAIVVTLRAVDGSYAKNFTGHTQSDLTFKILLDAMPTGGNYSATATCAACAGKRTAKIADLTFGDVFFCAGQSNSAFWRRAASYHSIACTLSTPRLRARALLTPAHRAQPLSPTSRSVAAALVHV